jgi:hypothetical protein
MQMHDIPFDLGKLFKKRLMCSFNNFNCKNHFNKASEYIIFVTMNTIPYKFVKIY